MKGHIKPVHLQTVTHADVVDKPVVTPACVLPHTVCDLSLLISSIHVDSTYSDVLSTMSVVNSKFF